MSNDSERSLPDVEEEVVTIDLPSEEVRQQQLTTFQIV